MLKKKKLLFCNRNNIGLMIIFKFKGKLHVPATANWKLKRVISSDPFPWMEYPASITKTMILPQFGRNYRLYTRIIDLMKHSAFVKASKTLFFSMILTQS